MTNTLHPEELRGKILIVDDNRDNLLVLESLLENVDVEVVSVMSGAAALKRMLKEEFMLVLLDINMPDMSGFEVAELMRSSAATMHIPIIFVTAAYMDKISMFKGYNIGAIDYLHKPVDEIILRSKVNCFLQLWRITESYKNSQKQLLELNEKLEQQVQERTESLRRALNEQRQTMDELAIIIDNLPCCVFYKDRENNFIRVNRYFADFHGLRCEDMAGKNFFDLYPREKAQTYWDDDLQVINSRQSKYNIEENWDTQLGLQWMLTSKIPYFQNGEVVGIIGLAVNITDRKEIEQEIIQAKEKAEKADNMKSEFLANISHEIRTPMNAIIGLTQLALETELSDQQRDYLTKVYNSSQSLLGLINDLLDLSKMEAGQLKFENIYFNIAEVLKALLDTFSVRCQEKQIDLQLDLDAAVPKMICGDPMRLGQVLRNIVGNAVKFTDKGIVKVSVDKISLDERSCVLRFMIKDTGKGIEKENIGKIFQPFVQEDASISRKYGGTGLGLSICKNLLDIMGGELEVSSVKGFGTTFTFKLKYIYENRDKALAVMYSKRFLIIGNDKSLLNLLLGCIKAWEGYVFVANSEADAAEMIKNAKEDKRFFDVIICDDQIKEGSAFSIVSLVKDMYINQREKMPMFIVLTNNSPGISEKMGKCDLTETTVLKKPIVPSMLYDSIMLLEEVKKVKVVNPEQESAKTGSIVSECTLKDLLILLAEDNLINQQVAAEFLKKCGAEVVVVNNGCEAIEAISQRKFDLVLMDMHMPKMDGIEATGKIREILTADELPIIATTAAVMEKEVQEFYDAGLNDHVAKPLKRDELLMKILQWARN